MWFVYILKCSDNTYYTGCTSDFDDRLRRHSKGENTYTKYRLPVNLIGYVAFQNKYKAYEFERYLKSGSGIAFSWKRMIG
jgi:putative endonuclease